jgi:hypothetical protein
VSAQGGTRPDIASGLSAVLIWAIFLVRASALFVQPGFPESRDERRWSAWAWRAPEIDRQLRAVSSQLQDGEMVVVLAPGPTLDPGWLGVHACYWLARQDVVALRSPNQRISRRSYLTLVALSESGPAQVLR